GGDEGEREGFGPEERAVPVCAAGSGLFFSSKTLHAAGHNRSDVPRRTLLSEWAGPGVLPTSAERHAYQGLKPRSADPAYKKQMRLTFPQFVAGGDPPGTGPNDALHRTCGERRATGVQALFSPAGR